MGLAINVVTVIDGRFRKVANSYAKSMLWLCGVLVLVLGFVDDANGLRSPSKSTTPINEDGNVVSEAPDVSNHRNLYLLPQTCSHFGPANNRHVHRLFEFPWMALLSYKTQSGVGFKCAGTIINDRYILTAAQCITNPKYEMAGVRIGEYDIRTEEDCEEPSGDEKVCAPKVQDLHVLEIIPHPNYKPVSSMSNDIALLRVDRMNLTLKNAKPVCLPLGSARNYNFTNQKAVVAGWRNTDTGLPTKVLMVAELPIVNNEECQQLYGNLIPIGNRQLCAGGRNGTNSCSGDGGGPLHVVDFVNDEMRYVQQGIVSFGRRDCSTEGFPGVHTRVAYYMDWILDTIKP